MGKQKTEKYSMEEIIMGILLIGMSFILFSQIIIRATTGKALTWAEELARYFYVWSVFLSLGCTIANRSNLRVDLIINKLPAKLRTLVNVLLDLLNAVLWGFLTYHGVSVVERVRLGHQLSPAMELPMYYVYYIVPIGFAIACLRSLQQVYLRIAEQKQNAAPENAAK